MERGSSSLSDPDLPPSSDPGSHRTEEVMTDNLRERHDVRKVGVLGDSVHETNGRVKVYPFDSVSPRVTENVRVCR